MTRSHLTRPEDRVRVSRLMRASRLLDLDVNGYAPIYAAARAMPVEREFTPTPSKRPRVMGRRSFIVRPVVRPDFTPARDEENYGAFLRASVEAMAAELLYEAELTGCRSADYPFQYDLDTIVELDTDVYERVTANGGPRFDELRRSKNGRAILSHWAARSTWRERYADPQEAFDGHAPMPEEDRELEIRLRFDEEELRYATSPDWAMTAVAELTVEQTDSQSRFQLIDGYSVIDHDAPVDVEVETREVDMSCWGRWNAEDAYVSKITAEKRDELISLLRDQGVDPTQRAVVRWVERTLEKKGANRLRAYASCCYQIRRSFHTGFLYRNRAEFLKTQR